MQKKSVKALLIDIENRLVRYVQIVDYKDILKALDCEYIDVVERELLNQGEPYTIYCDDIGKLVRKRISAYNPLNGETIVGNIIVSLTDDEGEMISLTDEQMNDIIFNSIITVNHKDNGQEYPLLVLD